MAQKHFVRMTGLTNEQFGRAYNYKNKSEVDLEPFGYVDRGDDNKDIRVCFADSLEAQQFEAFVMAEPQSPTYGPI